MFLGGAVSILSQSELAAVVQLADHPGICVRSAQHSQSGGDVFFADHNAHAHTQVKYASHFVIADLASLLQEFEDRGRFPTVFFQGYTTPSGRTRGGFRSIRHR